MIISPTTTKTAIINRQGRQHRIVINNKKIEQLAMFKYLGSIFSEDGRIELEFDMRISAASKLYGAINRKFLGKSRVSQKTKLTVYKLVYAPTLTYSYESWTLNDRHKKRIQAVEMRFLRRIEKKTCSCLLYTSGCV